MLRLFLGAPQGLQPCCTRQSRCGKKSQTSLSKSKTFHSCLKIKLAQFLVCSLFPLEYEAMEPDGQSNHVL